MLRDIERNPYEGRGKPEPLRGTLSGCWSRRVDDTNRIIYRVEDENLVILQCRGHYDDK